jgi:hypothetical protein
METTKKWSVLLLAVLAAGFAAAVLMGCASGPSGGKGSNAEYQEISISHIDGLIDFPQKMKNGQRFVLKGEGLINGSTSWNYYMIKGFGSTTTFSIADLGPGYESFWDRVRYAKLLTIYFTYNRGSLFTLTVVANPFVVDKIEGLPTVEEAQARKEQENAELAQAEAERKAAAEAREKAREAEFEKKQNPNNLDRSLYKKITVEDFSFDMVAGKLPAGSKVVFNANFLFKPTGTSYKFKDVNPLISIISDHNFVRDIPESRFTGVTNGNYVPSLTTVNVYVTVKQPGQTGECSVDIINWGRFIP